MVNFDEIPLEHIPWIEKQEMFWVASAPLSEDGHVNLSPKGLRDCLFVVNQKKVWYEDLTGSGAETIAHLRENGRITIMFNAFEGPPRILRLFGTGTVHEFDTPEYNLLIPPGKRKPGSRSAIVVDVHKVSTTCGYGVPYYSFLSQRTTLFAWADNKENRDRAECPISTTAETTVPAKGIRAFWVKHNLKSMDGLPSILTAHKSGAAIQSIDWKSQYFPGSSQNGGTTNGKIISSAERCVGAVKDATIRWFEEIKLVAVFSLGVLAASGYMRWSM